MVSLQVAGALDDQIQLRIYAIRYSRGGGTLFLRARGHSALRWKERVPARLAFRA